MPRSFAKITFAAVTLIAVAYAGALRAEENAKIKFMAFSITVPYKSDINVVSSTGKRWDTILSQNLPLWAHIKVETRHPGYVERAGIFLGTCSGTSCQNNPRPEFWSPLARDFRFDGYFHLDTSEIPITNDGIALSSLGDRILIGCNAEVDKAGGTSRVRSFDISVDASLSVNTRKAQNMSNAFLEGGSGFGGGDANARTSFSLRVNCLRFAAIEAPPEPFSVDLIVDPQGDSCPKKTAVTALIRYHQPTTARFRFKLDGELSELIQIKARKLGGKHGGPSLPAGKGVYLVERVKTYHLDPGQHHFRIEIEGGKKSAVKTLRIECPPFKVTSIWLTYDVADKDTCPKKVAEKVSAKATRPGQAPFEIKTAGGLVVHSGTATFKRKGMAYVAETGRNKLSLNAFDSDMMALIKTQPDANSGWVRLKVDCLEPVSGKLTLRGLGPTLCKGEALVAIHTNGAGELPYELECGPGKSWQRKVTALDNRIGVDKLRFDVANNEQITCTLRTRIGGKLTSLDGASKTFQCHKPSGVSGSDEFAPETGPDPKKPGKPGLAVIDTEPPITCAKGKVKNGACVCARTHKPVKAGENAWRCVKIVATDPPKKTTLSASTATKEITCKNGKVEDGACVCASTHKPVKTGKKAWRCKKIAATDPPKAVAKRKKK